MKSLTMRSLLVLFLLFGLLLAGGIGLVYHFHLPMEWAIGFAVGMVLFQYLTSPILIDWLFHIKWTKPDSISPEFGLAFQELCRKSGIPVPRFGIIEDGNPNAFTYGHAPKDARLVVTRGLVEMLSPEELQAVVTHEMGHICHWDFAVMTLASLVPMIFYIIFRWTKDDRGNKFGQASLSVAIGAYLVYLLSECIVLFLSRIREFYADEHAAHQTTSARSISTALIKIACGLGKLPENEEITEEAKKKDEKKKTKTPIWQSDGSLGFNCLKASGSMALHGVGPGGELDSKKMAAALRWDLFNPWARFFELMSTHPLVVHRVQEADRIARQRGEEPVIGEVAQPTESYARCFGRDLLIACLPYPGVAIISYCILSMKLHDLPTFLHLLGIGLVMVGVGWLIRLMFSYRNDFKPAKIEDLVQEIDVSHVNCIPVEIHGRAIGRGIPGIFWSKDLVIEDGTGFLTALYKQPISIAQTFFGVFKAPQIINKQVVFRGWYRRGPIPYLELFDGEVIDHDTDDPIRFHCWARGFYIGLALTIMLAGIVLMYLNY